MPSHHLPGLRGFAGAAIVVSTWGGSLLHADAMFDVTNADLSITHSGAFSVEGGGDATASATASVTGWQTGDADIDLAPVTAVASDGGTSWTVGASGSLRSSTSNSGQSGTIGFGASFSDTLVNPDARDLGDFQGGISTSLSISFTVTGETTLQFLDGIWYGDLVLSTAAGDIRQDSYETGPVEVIGGGSATFNFDTHPDIRLDGGAPIRISAGTYTLTTLWEIGPVDYGQWPDSGVGFEMFWANSTTVPGPAGLGALAGLLLLTSRRR